MTLTILGPCMCLKTPNGSNGTPFWGWQGWSYSWFLDFVYVAFACFALDLPFRSMMSWSAFGDFGHGTFTRQQQLGNLICYAGVGDIRNGTTRGAWV